MSTTTTALPIPAARPAVRWLPSFIDLFFISLVSWLWLSARDGWYGLLMDGDVGWHIRAGEWMIAHGQVPQTDLFSFSRPNGEWFAWEWLADVLFASLHQMAGLKGVVLCAGFVIAGFAALLLRYVVWKGSNAFVAFAVTLLSVGAASVHFHARPHIFTLLFFTVSVFLVEADLQRPTRHIAWLVPLTVVWTNLHGGFPVLIAYLALIAAGTAGEILLGWRSAGPRSWSVPGRYALLAAGCGLASLVNPYGYRVHLHIAEYLRSDFIHNNVMEFMAPNFRTEPLLQFKLILFLALLAAGALLWRRQMIPALVVLFFAHQALQSVRHVTLFVIVAAPLVGAEITRLWGFAAGRCGRKDTIRLLYEMASDVTGRLQYATVLPVLFAAAVALGPWDIDWPADFPRQIFPVQIYQDHQNWLAGKRLLAPDQWSDYLIYRNYPAQRVFFDGRSDFYGAELGKDYLTMLQGRYDWQEVLERHRIEAVLCPPSWPLSSLLKERRDWRLIADKGSALLFLRGSGSQGKP